MNSNVRKCLRRRPAIIFLMLMICLLTFFGGKHAYASTAGDSATTTDGTNIKNGSNEASDTGNSLNGTLGPIRIQMNTDDKDGGLASTLQMLLVLTVISLAPSILIMVTSFTRILIILHFVRSAIGTQTTPPNQILIGLALFITFFIMTPTFSKVNTDAIQPLSKGEITQEEAYDKGIAPIREFMLGQLSLGIDGKKDLYLFRDIAQIKKEVSNEKLPITVIIPAFIISELRKAFIIGFIIYIPFIVIDMVVASTLMSMGMMMMPPTMISMPFKILLFIMVDGWNLIIGQVVKTFYSGG